MSDPRNPDRPFDIVLFGATGFTGGLTADHLAAHAPDGLRWAIAGRNADKLEAVRQRLGGDVKVLVADATDPAALADVARQARVVVTTVGPYLAHGGTLVAACAEAGTDYLDLTGEPEFVDRTYLEQHQTAQRTGARIVHACGFDSIPHDLGAYYTVQQLPSDQPITMRGVVRSGGMFSGGTFHSALDQFARAKQMKQTYAERRRAEGKPLDGRSSRSVGGRPHRDSLLGYWLLPLPTIDPIIVARSGAALPAYGPRFRYSHWAGTKTLRYAAGGAVGVGVLTVAAQVKPARNFLKGKVPQGSGPDEAKREKSWFTVDFVVEAGGQTVRTRVSGGDPGYTETAKMLSEAALCLAFDDNPETSGQVTTAVAMGDALLARLQAAGIRFETL
jgi:short subunit dehydrogenase-like uncharacterized protein